MVNDAIIIAPIAAPAVATSYQRMLKDLQPYPTILSDEASIDIVTGRPWYWGDPLVLTELGRTGKWDDSFIESGLEAHRFAAVVVRNPDVWSRFSDNLKREYRAVKTYPASNGTYTVYLPR